jgi:hypothetical protein
MAQVMTDDFVGVGRPRTLGFQPEVGKQAYISRFLASPISNYNVRFKVPLHWFCVDGLCSVDIATQPIRHL